MRSGRLECTQNRSVSDLVTTIANPLAPSSGSAIVAAERWRLTDYDAAIAWQTRRAANVAADAAAEIVLMLEHAPVYTMGRRGGRKHLLVGERALSAALIDSDRGGDITFHGPGQLVVYPILRLRERGLGIVTYIRMLEAVFDLDRRSIRRSRRARTRPARLLGRRAQARLGRRTAARRRLDPRPRAERLHRPQLVRCDHTLRHRGRADDLHLARVGAHGPRQRCRSRDARRVPRCLRPAPGTAAERGAPDDYESGPDQPASANQAGSAPNGPADGATARSSRCCATRSCTPSARRPAAPTSASASTAAPPPS